MNEMVLSLFSSLSGGIGSGSGGCEVNREGWETGQPRSSPPAHSLASVEKGNKPGLESGILTRLRHRQEKADSESEGRKY